MRWRCAFTLVELLVVVAIIALLVGMLLPALGGARTAALQAASSNNMRQLGTAMHQYMDDHDGKMPRSTHEDVASQSWIFTLRPYFDGAGAQAGSEDLSSERFRRASFDRIRLCPADPAGEARLLDGGSSYILNSYLAAPIRAISPIGLGPVIADYSTRRKVTNPTQTYTLFLIADGSSPGLGQDHTHSDLWASLPTAADRWKEILSDIEPGRFGGDPVDIEDFSGGVPGEPLTYERKGRSSYLFFDAHVESIDADVIAQFAIAGDDFARPR